MPYFHAFTVCDTTSQFYGIGKRSACEAFPNVSQASGYISDHLFAASSTTSDSKVFEILERFCCLMYDRTTIAENVNELRKEMFPTKNSCYVLQRHCYMSQHVNRAVYQTSIWVRTVTRKYLSQTDLAGPEWRKNGSLFGP
jgi:hypothetical protein